MTLREDVARFCSAHRLSLNTDLGQHFLVDERALAAIVDAARLQESDNIVEIGPGIGILTKELLARCARVTAIEVDARMIPLLTLFTARAGSPDPKLDIVRGNALEVPLPTVPYKMVANIPYHITSPLLRHAFLESSVPPSSLTLLIQREVAERICDPDNAGLLTIIVGMFGKATLVTRVPSAAFIPPPQVESAVLHIDCHPRPLAQGAVLDQALRLAKIGFGQKRKMLSNTIGHLPEAAVLHTCGIDPTRRPQTLSVDDWCRLGEAAVALEKNADDAKR